MIEEAYVSFETAKLLKNKGFDVPCKSYYSKAGAIRNIGNYCNTLLNAIKSISAPTQQMAMRWLREVHGIHIIIDYSPAFKEYSFDISEIDKLMNGYIYDTYEEAAEAAIKYCLENLI